jgi:acyl-CoA reductase-like NAD-dependent aldehyde dehydrogenase
VISFIHPELQVNNAQVPEVGVPFGGYKQSGIGRELGEYALDTYVHHIIQDLESSS